MKKILKICGIRNPLKSYDGINYLGFNFIKTSKRKISIEKAKKIITPENVNRVGLFGKFENKVWQNLDKIYLDEIIKIAKETKINSLQIYGNCDFGYLKKYGFYIIHAISYNEVNNIIKDENIDLYIIDSPNPGSGKGYNYEILNRLKLSKPFLIAGGINEFNLQEVLTKVPNASGVDIASGVDNGKNICNRKAKRIVKIIDEINN
ncbi:MAG: phosphoribosylanthranilate isomerase [Candidatus Gracilibacteria bacterium]